ncbi:phasin family protein [Azospirillum sp.]|uniref:phasin family protein n=1 Tax=Azospirillum sp. TaxID=34012 RepID=UPI003D760AEC
MTAQITAIAKAPKVLDDVATQAKKGFEDLAKSSQEQVAKASQQLNKGYQDLAVLGQANLDAVVKANTILFKGFEDVSRQAAAFTQASFEKAAATGQSLLSVKSPQDAFALQSAFAQQSVQSFVAESTRLSQLSAKIVQEAFAPIAARVEVTVAAVSKPLAA